MKKSKVIKLVLVSSLLGSGSIKFSNAAPEHTLITSPIKKSESKKSFAGMSLARNGYYSEKDTSERHVGSGGSFHPVIARGGFGLFGHAAHACS
jgi:hypothetical protein